MVTHPFISFIPRVIHPGNFMKNRTNRYFTHTKLTFFGEEKGHASPTEDGTRSLKTELWTRSTNVKVLFLIVLATKNGEITAVCDCFFGKKGHASPTRERD